MDPRISLCSVVTTSVLPEFRLLKYSFDLFYGDGYRWFLRTDETSANALSADPAITCTVFTQEIANRPDIESGNFRVIVAEKMKAFADAWDSGSTDSVVFMDADLVITARLLDILESLPGQVLLTPNYYPKQHEHLIPIHGYYNAGLVLSRDRAFHEWWQSAFTSHPTSWTDQAVLNEAEKRFTIGTIPSSANIGFWRSPNAWRHARIPADCSCLHVHFFQPLRSARQWIDRAFALHCVEFLRASTCPCHQMLLKKILSMDHPEWYRATLQIR